MDKLIDILLLAIIIICGWAGYKKGIIMGIGGILVIIVSLYGAHLLSATFSYEIIPALRPFASGYTEKKISEDVLPAMDWEKDGYSVEGMLAEHPSLQHKFCSETFLSLGIYSVTADKMADEALDYAEQNDASITNSIIDVLCSRLTYALGFLLFFLLILIVLTVIGNLPNFSFKFPAYNIVNDILGAVAGVITGFMFCFIIAWALKFAGIVIGSETLSEAPFASWLMKKDILSRFIGI